MKRKSSRIFVKMIIMTVMALAVVSVGSAALATVSLQFAPDEEQPVGAANNGELTITKDFAKDLLGQRRFAATTYYTLPGDEIGKARIQFKVKGGFTLLGQEREAYVVPKIEAWEDIRDIVQLKTWRAEYDHKDKMVVLTSMKPTAQMPEGEKSFYVMLVDTRSTLPDAVVIADAILNTVEIEVNKQNVSLPLSVDDVQVNIGENYRGEHAKTREFTSNGKVVGAFEGELLFTASDPIALSAEPRQLWKDTDLTAALGKLLDVSGTHSCMFFRSETESMRGTAHKTEISVVLAKDNALRILSDGKAKVAGARGGDTIAKFKVTVADPSHGGSGGGGCDVGAGICFAGLLVLAGLALTRKRTRT